MKKIRVVLDWFANTNHTGLYVAKERGYYREAGLEVEIHGEVHGVMQVGGADIIFSPQPALLTGIAKGDKITAVAVLTQKNDSGILSLRESGIEGPRDLMGKRLTHWKPQWFHGVLKKAVEDAGGDYGQVNLLQMDVGDIDGTLGGAADAVWVYKNWEYFVMVEQGKEVGYFAFADVDPLFDFCAPCVAASHALIDSDPGALRAFLSATDRGYIDAAGDPDTCAELLHRNMTEPVSPALVRDSQRYIAGLYLDETGHWGTMRPQRWERFADWMVETGLIPTRTGREYTNDFLPR